MQNIPVTVPDWVKDVIFYQIFPERFANGDTKNDPANSEPWGAKPKGNNSFGGDLQGIRDHLAHLDSLGVTLLYLNPIWSSGSAHGYDTWDYLTVEPSCGDERVLRALLDESSEPDRALLIVTHKLDEVLQVADRAVVMRQGRIVEEVQRSEFSAQAMARAMVGREVFSLRRPSSDLRTEQPVRAVPLRVRDLVVSRAGVDWVRGVSLDVPSGQIVGIAGVAGNGQSELVESLSGLLSAKSGQVVLCGDDVTTQDVKARAQRGLAVVPEDRQRHGLVLDMSLCENLLLGHETELSYGPGRQLLDWTKLRGLAAEVLPEAEVRPADPEALARTLSGGNQQKVVLARALAMAKSLPKVLIAAQPTRGVDIGAIETNHKTLLAAKEAGCAILLLSAELSELQALCDRILVMYRGKLVASLDNDPQSPVSREQLGELMAGVGTTVES